MWEQLHKVTRQPVFSRIQVWLLLTYIDIQTINKMNAEYNNYSSSKIKLCRYFYFLIFLSPLGKKLSLSAPGLALSPIPAVDVVTYKTGESGIGKKGYQPGPSLSKSWNRDGNCIPCSGTHGNFALHFSTHDPLHKLKIAPLVSEEKLGHLWSQPGKEAARV